MNGYIYKIINFFFRHDVSDEMAGRFYDRMISPAEDEDRESAMQRIWNEQEGAVCSEETIDKAFHRLELSLKAKMQLRVTDTVRHNKERGRKGFNWYRIAATWLIPFIMVCGSIYYYYHIRSSVKETLDKLSYIHCYVPVGERKQVTLPDGSEVSLNAGSLLIYPSEFISVNRDVYLAGEAFFKVRENQNAPFVVTTNHLKMKVLGTTFNVSAYPDNDRFTATLETGKLQVTVNELSENYFLAPDEQLIYTPSVKEVLHTKVKAVSYSDWRMGALFFDNLPFNDVIRSLERVYNVKFHQQNSTYQNQKLRVYLNKGESLEHVLRIIKILIPDMDYEIKGKDVYLKSLPSDK